MYNAADLDKQIKLPVDEKLVEQLFDIYINGRKSNSAEKINGVIRQIRFMLIDDEPTTKEEKIKNIEKQLYNRLQVRGVSSYTKQAESQIDVLRAAFDWSAYMDAKQEGISRTEYYDDAYELMGWYCCPASRSKEKSHKNKHRLYFNVCGVNRWKLANILYHKLKKSGKPFSFKVLTDSAMNRVDGLVWYIRSDCLQQSLRIVDDIIRENPELLKDSKASPIMGQMYGGRVGYGAELPYKGYSYSSLVCTVFAETLFAGIENYQIPGKPKYSGLDQFDQYVKDYVKDKGFISAFTRNFRRKLQGIGLDPDNMCFNPEEMKKIKDHNNQMLNNFNRGRE